MVYEKDTWDDRFRSGGYSRNPEPPRVLEQYVETFPDGRALDIATGTGRISVFLAKHGYVVDAVEQSEEGIRIARQRARDVGEDVNWIQADALDYVYPESTYDVVTIRSCRLLDRLTDIKAALKPEGILFYQDHMRTTEPLQSGPSDDQYRVGANELLRNCLDLTILHYKEFTAVKDDGDLDAYAQVIARKSTAPSQRLPRRELYQNRGR